MYFGTPCAVPITITVADFQSACAACAQNIVDGDWANAWKNYAKAEAINVGLDVSSSVSGGTGGFSTQRRDSLRGLREAIEAAQKASTQAGDNNRFVHFPTGFGR